MVMVTATIPWNFGDERFEVQKTFSSSYLASHEQFETREACEAKLPTVAFDVMPGSVVSKSLHGGVVAERVRRNGSASYSALECIQLILESE